MRCKQCLQAKTAADFYSSNKSRCKESVKANRVAKIDYYRGYDRMRGSMPHRVAARAAYQETEAYKESHLSANNKYRNSHPLRNTARNAVNNAVRDKRLTPWPVCAVPDCICKPEAHHPDYSRPLDVVWLCDLHHKEAHNIAKEAKRSASTGAFSLEPA